MKTALLLLLVSLSLSAFADYKSEEKAIEKFEKEEFLNKKNFTEKKNGPPGINKPFYERLLKEPQSLKYFMVISTFYKTVGKYNKDKAFALALESKFGGKKMDSAKWEKVAEFMSNNVLKESNSEHKKAISTDDGSDDHFEKQIALLKTASFK